MSLVIRISSFNFHNMKILLITQWYKPINAPVKRMVRIAEHLAFKDHQVTVLTGMPSYPTGILPQKYKWKIWTKERENSIDIIRTYEYPTPNKGVFKRLFNNLSFIISASIAVLILPAYDIVIISSPSFLSGIPGLLASMRQKTYFIFDIRDLWPDSAVDLNFITKKWLINMLKWLEALYYRRAKIIFGATPGIINHLKSEKIPKEKLWLLLNSVDTTAFRPQKVSRKTYGFKENDFIVAYIGNHSTVQNLKTSILAARILKNKKDIKFLFVGEGEEKESLVELAQKLRLDNVIFWSLKKTEEVNKTINIVDICNISLAPIKIFQDAIPSKTSEYLSCGKPVIASVSGDLKKYIEGYQAGIIYKADNEKECAQAILKLYKNPNLKQKMGENARRLALDIFSNKKFYHILDEVFENLN